MGDHDPIPMGAMTTGILSLGLFLLVFVSAQEAEFGQGETILFEKDRSDVRFAASDSEQDHPANAKDADNRVPTDMASENPKNSAITEVEAGSRQKIKSKSKDKVQAGWWRRRRRRRRWWGSWGERNQKANAERANKERGNKER